MEKEALSRLSEVGRGLSCFQDTGECGTSAEETWGLGDAGTEEAGDRLGLVLAAVGGGKGRCIDAGCPASYGEQPQATLNPTWGVTSASTGYRGEMEPGSA